MDRATYLRELAAAYQGEVRGEAMFRTLAARAGDDTAAETWRTLAKLEAATRERLLPLLRRHGLNTSPDPGQQQLGGEARAALGLGGAVRAMSESLPKYLKLYAELAATGPAGDRDGLTFLHAHEIALQQFCARRIAGREDALAPVLALLGA
jgi:hypothetical protein